MRHGRRFLVERHVCRNAGVAIVAGHILDGGNKAVAAVRLEAVRARIQRLPDGLPRLIRDFHRRNEQLVLHFSGEIEEMLRIFGEGLRHSERIRKRRILFCRYFFFQRFFLWELFRVRVFFGRSVHDLFCFGDRCIVRRHAYRQAGQEHRQQKQHRNQAFHKIPPVQDLIKAGKPLEPQLFRPFGVGFQ